MSAKRKHATLTLQVKHEIIKNLSNGVSKKTLAEKYGVGRATIYDIEKNKEKIQKFVSNVDSKSGDRKTLRGAENTELEEALYIWFLQEIRRNTLISGPLLSAKAKYFYEKITGKTDFSASSGWLEGFKKRHGIRFLRTKAEKVSRDTTPVEEFQNFFLQKVVDLNLCPSQVYNADESDLQWRVLTNKTFVSSNESEAFERKISNDRVTFLPCSNASGQHTLKLLVVGKAQKPRAFKNIDLPVYYFGQKKGWITRELFKKWFFECFVPEVRKWLKDHNLSPTALLVLDNAPSHPPTEELTSDDGLITAIFMPPNCTPVLQPMNQSVIQCVKENYKKKLLFDALANNQSVANSLKNFDLKDMAFLLAYSWDLLKQSTIISSWEPLWPNISSILNSAETIDGKEIKNEYTMATIITNVSAKTQILYDELQAWYDGSQEHNSAAEFLSDEAIVELATDTIDEGEDDNENLPNSITSINASEAIKSLEVSIKWAEEQGCPSSEILVLKRVQDKALKKKKEEEEWFKEH